MAVSFFGTSAWLVQNRARHRMVPATKSATAQRIERAPIPLKEPAPKKPPPQHHAAAATPALLAVRQDPQNGDKLMNCETEASLVIALESANWPLRGRNIRHLQRGTPTIVKRR